MSEIRSDASEFLRILEGESAAASANPLTVALLRDIEAAGVDVEAADLATLEPVTEADSALYERWSHVLARSGGLRARPPRRTGEGRSPLALFAALLGIGRRGGRPSVGGASWAIPTWSTVVVISVVVGAALVPVPQAGEPVVRGLGLDKRELPGAISMTLHAADPAAYCTSLKLTLMHVGGVDITRGADGDVGNCKVQFDLAENSERRGAMLDVLRVAGVVASGNAVGLVSIRVRPLAAPVPLWKHLWRQLVTVSLSP